VTSPNEPATQGQDAGDSPPWSGAPRGFSRNAPAHRTTHRGAARAPPSALTPG